MALFFLFLWVKNKSFQVFIIYFYPYKAFAFALKNKQVGAGGTFVVSFILHRHYYIY